MICSLFNSKVLGLQVKQAAYHTKQSMTSKGRPTATNQELPQSKLWVGSGHTFLCGRL